jgi:hypothetical protein
MPYTTEQVPFVQGMKPGMGVNLVTGQVTTLVFPTLPTVVNSSPSFTEQEDCIQTSQDYASLIEVTGDAEGQAWTEGGEVTVNASTAFLRQLNYTAQALGFVCYRSSTTVSDLPTTATINGLQLPATVSDRILNDPEGFLADYGTHFIAGFVNGGSFIGSVQVQATSESELQSIQATLGVQIKEFDAGSGRIDSSFVQNLQEAAQTHKVSIKTGGNGVNPPQYDPSTVENMQDYMDNQFVTDLGTGVPLVAVCFPWEALPCVMNLPGYVPGTLSPAIDQGVLSTLRNEYRRLDYAASTAENMQENNIFVSDASAQTLQSDLVAVNEAQSRIENLTFAELQTLNQSDITPYLASTQYLADLAAIAAGRAEIAWSLGLDGAFTPNTQSDPGAIATGSVLASPGIDTMTTVLQAQHGDGALTCGFVYSFVPVPVGSQPPSGLQNQVELVAQMTWGKHKYTGTPVIGNQPGQASQTHWEKYQYDQIGVWFGP